MCTFYPLGKKKKEKKRREKDKKSLKTALKGMNYFLLSNKKIIK